MSTTLVIAAIEGEKAYFMHLGDSRAYLLRGDKAYQLTLDHTWIQEALDEGRVTPEQERYFALKDVARAIAADLDRIDERDDRTTHLVAGQPAAIGRRSRYRAVKLGGNRTWGKFTEPSQPFASILSAVSMEEAVRELIDAAEPADPDADLSDPSAQVWRQTQPDAYVAWTVRNEGRYDVTAISFGAYPELRDRYDLLTAGSSIQEGTGPLVVSRTPLDVPSLKALTIAIPGKRTSAYLSMRKWCAGHGFEPSVELVPFDGALAQREGWPRRGGRQDAFEAFAGFGQLGRQQRLAAMHFRADVGGDKADDPLTVRLGQLHTHRRAARGQSIHPKGAVGVQHDFHHVRVFERGGDQRPHGRAQHLDAAIQGNGGEGRNGAHDARSCASSMRAGSGCSSSTTSRTRLRPRSKCRPSCSTNCSKRALPWARAAS